MLQTAWMLMQTAEVDGDGDRGGGFSNDDDGDDDDGGGDDEGDEVPPI